MAVRFLYVAVITFACYVMFTQHQRISNLEHNVSDVKEDVGIIKQILLEQRPTHIRYSQKDFECLARNIFFEAGVEDTLGKIAVAHVTINRLQAGKWGNDICDVVYSKAQFSWTKVKKRAWVKLKGRNWEESKRVARKVLDFGYRIKPLDNALFYHADYVNPNWRDNNKKVAQIGRHIFYTDARKI